MIMKKAKFFDDWLQQFVYGQFGGLATHLIYRNRRLGKFVGFSEYTFTLGINYTRCYLLFVFIKWHT